MSSTHLADSGGRMSWVPLGARKVGSPMTGRGSCLHRSTQAEKVDHEHESFVRADDPARAALAVGQSRGDHDAPAAADAHAGHAVVPALDDLALAEAEGERV